MVDRDTTSSDQENSPHVKKKLKSDTNGTIFGNGGNGGGIGAKDTSSSVALNTRMYPMNQQPQWQACIERAIRAIVSIRFSQTAAFDTVRKKT